MVRCKKCKFYYQVDEESPRYCVHPLIIAQPELSELVQKSSIAIVSHSVDSDDFLFQPGPEFGCIHGVDCIGCVKTVRTKNWSGGYDIDNYYDRIESEPSQEEQEKWDEWMGAMLYPDSFQYRKVTGIGRSEEEALEDYKREYPCPAFDKITQNIK